MSQREGPGYPVRETPAEVWGKLDEIFHFNWDAAADEQNAKCDGWWGEEENALLQTWGPLNFEGIPANRNLLAREFYDDQQAVYWCNPPYKGGLLPWTKKYLEARSLGNIAVGLHPNTTDAEWFQLAHREGMEQWLVTPRIQYDGKGSSNTLGSVIQIAIPGQVGLGRIRVWNWVTGELSG